MPREKTSGERALLSGAEPPLEEWCFTTKIWYLKTVFPIVFAMCKHKVHFDPHLDPAREGQKGSPP